MKGSIRLHSKHGVNPTIPICFFCGESRNEVALLGAAYKGEAPMHMVIDYQPCDTCKSKWNSGVVLVEGSTSPKTPGQPAIVEGFYPTGRWMVVTVEAIGRIVNNPKLAKDITEHRRALIDVGAFEKMIGPMQINRPEGSA